MFGARQGFRVCTGAPYLEGYIGDNKSKRDWLRERSDVGEEYQHDQRNRGEISPGELRLSGTCNPIRIDFFSTRHLGHRRLVRGSGEDDSINLFASSFLQKDENPLPVVGAISTMLVRKAGLGLLNPVTSVQDKYLSSTQGSAELILAVAGGGGFCNYDHLRTLSEERHDRK